MRRIQPGQSLTVQETAVCEFMARGLANKEIAHQMELSTRTVEQHRQRAMVKKGARNSLDLVRLVLTEQFTKANGGIP